MSIVHDITNKLVLWENNQKETVLQGILIDRAGTDEPKLLWGRLMAVKHAHEPQTTYHLDGKAMISFWPPEFELVGMTMSAKQKYIIHKDGE